MEPSGHGSQALLEMAIALEEKGIAYYERCVELTGEQPSAALFRYLGEQEVTHAEKFRKMKSELQSPDTPGDDLPRELESYLRSYTEEPLFPTDREAQPLNVKEIENTSQAIELGLELERRSILFYSGLRSQARSVEWNVLDAIIAEEHNHVRRLLELRSSLREVPDW